MVDSVDPSHDSKHGLVAILTLPKPTFSHHVAAIVVRYILTWKYAVKNREFLATVKSLSETLEGLELIALATLSAKGKCACTR